MKNRGNRNWKGIILILFRFFEWFENKINYLWFDKKQKIKQDQKKSNPLPHGHEVEIKRAVLKPTDASYDLPGINPFHNMTQQITDNELYFNTIGNLFRLNLVDGQLLPTEDIINHELNSVN